ncbi:MAG: proton-conducting transporter membrane subunit [Oceanicaulis sp.]
MMLVPLGLIGPIALFLAAAFAFSRPGRRPKGVPALSEAGALIALAAALAGLVQRIVFGVGDLSLFSGPFALVFRLDSLSATMSVLVAFVGWIVVRYARPYLDGAEREGRFHALMSLTLGAVLALAQAGSVAILILAFLAVGGGIRQLLLFYAERSEARRAATKFTLVWRAGDAALVIAGVLLVAAYGTGDLAVIAAQVPGVVPPAAHAAVAFLVLCAALKTAAFPVHGWLTEVMEAPTPVSALLHAGVINAGGFLLIRNADLVQASPGAMAALVMIGGLTALFGAVVMLTQSAVKTALAWSTVSQMGFMLLQCGLGLWPLALLHIVAHSLYKAHAFLSSGGAVAAVASLRRPGPIAAPSPSTVFKSFTLSVALFALVAAGFALAFGAKSPQALALGAMLIFGVAYLVAQGMADAAPADLTRRTGIAALAAALAYFTFQQIAAVLWGGGLPPTPGAGPLEWALIVLSVASFGAVAVAQTLFPLWAHHPSTAGLRVHLVNGLYLNALLDRLIGGFRTTGGR